METVVEPVEETLLVLDCDGLEGSRGHEVT